MEDEAFFLDSYAIHEIVEGSDSYKRFARRVKIMTTKLNLMEVYYSYLIKKGEGHAELVFNRFRGFCAEIGDEDYKNAMRFKASIRKERPKSNLSYIDAVGYAIAKKHGLKFLTGDKEFKGMENVEFAV